MGFFRQEYWSGLPFPPPGDLPDPGIEAESLRSPAFAGGFFPSEPPGKPAITAAQGALGQGTASPFSAWLPGWESPSRTHHPNLLTCSFLPFPLRMLAGHVHTKVGLVTAFEASCFWDPIRIGRKKEGQGQRSRRGSHFYCLLTERVHKSLESH